MLKPDCKYLINRFPRSGGHVQADPDACFVPAGIKAGYDERIVEF